MSPNPVQLGRIDRQFDLNFLSHRFPFCSKSGDTICNHIFLGLYPPKKVSMCLQGIWFSVNLFGPLCRGNRMWKGTAGSESHEGNQTAAAVLFERGTRELAAAGIRFWRQNPLQTVSFSLNIRYVNHVSARVVVS